MDAALKLGLDEHNGIKGARVGPHRGRPEPAHSLCVQLVHRSAARNLQDRRGGELHRLRRPSPVQLREPEPLQRRPGVRRHLQRLQPELQQHFDDPIHVEFHLPRRDAFGETRHSAARSPCRARTPTAKRSTIPTAKPGAPTGRTRGTGAPNAALAGFDVRHRLNLVGVWNMPFFKDSNHMALAHWVLGGWQLSGLAILR